MREMTSSPFGISYQEARKSSLLQGRNGETVLVPEAVRKCVAFVCGKVPQSGDFTLEGTAFAISRADKVNPLKRHIYYVTAKHLLEEIEKDASNGKRDGVIYLRVNSLNEKPEMLQTHTSAWLKHPSPCVDVAILPFTGIDESVLDVVPFPVENVATDDVLKDKNGGPVGVGDEVFVAGVFTTFFGQHRNTPIVRIGNIAMLPEEPIVLDDGAEVSAYLVELKSTRGLSGSPVFVNLAGTRQSRLNLGDHIYWLGVIHGHFELKRSGSDADPRSEELFHAGLAIVVPIEEILPLFDVLDAQMTPNS